MYVYLLLKALTALATSGTINYVPPEQFEYVCEYAHTFYDVSCGDIAAPAVVVLDLNDYQLYGIRWPDTNFVLIDDNVEEVSKGKVSTNSVVVHETMHYVLDYTGAEVDRCTSEEIARRVGASWDNIEYSEDWRKWYDC